MPDYGATQDGYHDSAEAPWLGSGLWIEGGVSFRVLGAAGPAGLVFDVATGFEFTALSLALSGELAAVGSGTLRLYIVPAASAALFGDGNLPTTAGKTLVASAAVVETEIVPVVLTINASAVNAVAALSGWGGRLAFVLELDALVAASRQYGASEGAAGPVLSVTLGAQTEAAVNESTQTWFAGRFTEAAFSRG